MSITDLLNNAPDAEPERQYYFIQEAKKIIEKKEQELGRKLTCCVTTFGCQMNARDSEKLLGVLKEIGYVETESENADKIFKKNGYIYFNKLNELYNNLSPSKTQNYNIIHITICFNNLNQITLIQ